MSTSSHPVTEYASKINRLARKNPAGTILAAIGCGLAVGLLVRSLRPRTPESRAARLLTDIRDRLHGIAMPVRRQAEHLLESSTNAVHEGVAHLHDLHLERGLRKFGKRVRSLFD